MKIRKNDITLFLMLLGVWMVVLFVPPLAIYVATRSGDNAFMVLRMVLGMLQAPLVLFFLNFYVFWRFFFARRRYVVFAVVNLLLLCGVYLGPYFRFARMGQHGVELPRQAWLGMFSGHFLYFLLCVFVITAAIALRHWLTTRQIRQQLEEERHKNTEAELAWLKNQINPHFLFNTLNNISSLTQIDPDQAQDAIAQLSDLLRYAMYETNKRMVPVSGEVEFMQNYIDLMHLRCNDKTEVRSEWRVKDGHSEVAPLLFVSLIENAFKHGVSAANPSFVHVALEQTDGQIVFTCDNSNYPKDDRNRSGSGIGIENLRRRLELIYHGRYEYEQTLSDNVYHVRIKLKN